MKYQSPFVFIYTVELSLSIHNINMAPILNDSWKYSLNRWKKCHLLVNIDCNYILQNSFMNNFLREATGEKNSFNLDIVWNSLWPPILLYTGKVLLSLNSQIFWKTIVTQKVPQNFWKWFGPSPLYGQCPNSSHLFFPEASLTHLENNGTPCLSILVCP